MSGDRSEILRWFDSSHLPNELRITAVQFKRLAEVIDQDFPSGPEKSVCLRKLLEAKDAAVRCAVFERDKHLVREESEEERAQRQSDEALQVLRNKLTNGTPYVIPETNEGRDLITRLVTPVRGGMQFGATQERSTSPD